jgi:hypothetical protein
MQVFEVGSWTLNVDVNATIASYARMTGAHSDGCNLVSCANFVANRDNTFPEAAKRELEDLGVPWRKEVYVNHTGGVAEGLYHYEGFFMLVGQLLEEGPQVAKTRRTYHWIHGQVPSADYAHSFGTMRSVPYFATPAFDTHVPLLRCHFTTSIPWVIDAPYAGP